MRKGDRKVKVRLFWALILLTTFLGNLFVERDGAEALESSSVQAAYIQPVDAREPSQATLDRFKSALLGAQRFYGLEMERYGYGYKTFAVADAVKVIKSNQTKAQYFSKTSTLVFEELIKDHDVLEEIYVVLVGGIELVDTVHGGLAIGSDYPCGGCKGAAILAASDRSFSLKTIAHELGHTFGLNHISHLKGNYLMGSAPDNDHPLMAYETHWLNVHPYFNERDHNYKGRLPYIGTFHPPEPVGLDWIHFFVDVSSVSGVHQAQLVFHNSVIVADYDWVYGKSDTAIFLINRDLVYQNPDAWVHLIDKNGLYTAKYAQLEAPDPELITIPLDPISSRNLDELPLTIRGSGNDSLNAINNPAEWDGWIEGVWEKTPNNDYPQKPRWYNPFPYMDIWDHWFYSCAQSRLVWDITETDLAIFNAQFYLPNPCGNVALLSVQAYADGRNVYDSGALHVANAQNKKIAFTIPSGTTELELKVLDLGDITCDHFVFGNPRLLSHVGSAPEKVKGTILTQWAKLKDMQ